MTHPDTTKSYPYSPHLGPVVGCLPAPNIFPLAKETFAKGKMFWNVGRCYMLEFRFMLLMYNCLLWAIKLLLIYVGY